MENEGWPGGNPSWQTKCLPAGVHTHPRKFSALLSNAATEASSSKTSLFRSILSQHQELITKDEQLISREREIEHLKLLLVKPHRMQFGRKSEKLQRQIEQLELRLEELESNRSEKEPTPEPTSLPVSATPTTAKPAHHLPRETRQYEPKETVCPQCQGELRKLGEDVAEVLEYVPGSFRVIRHVRTKVSCTKCDCIVQAEEPSRPNRARPSRAGTADACAGVEVLRSSATLSAKRDLCASRSRVTALDPSGLGGRM